jgi:hypothetical protein
MSDPNAGILEEISDQQLDEFSAGDPILITGIAAAASWVIGNQGWLCTTTLECQRNCV